MFARFESAMPKLGSKLLFLLLMTISMPTSVLRLLCLLNQMIPMPRPLIFNLCFVSLENFDASAIVSSFQVFVKFDEFDAKIVVVCCSLTKHGLKGSYSFTKGDATSVAPNGSSWVRPIGSPRFTISQRSPTFSFFTFGCSSSFKVRCSVLL